MRECFLHASHLGKQHPDVVVGDSVTETTASERMKENLHIIAKHTEGREKLLCSNFQMTRRFDSFSAHSNPSNLWNLHGANNMEFDSPTALDQSGDMQRAD